MTRPSKMRTADMKQWECSDIFFTRCPLCSSDRTAHDLNNPLNILHCSITTVAQESPSSHSRPINTKSPAVRHLRMDDDVRRIVENEQVCKQSAKRGSSRVGMDQIFHGLQVLTIDYSTPDEASSYSRDQRRRDGVSMRREDGRCDIDNAATRNRQYVPIGGSDFCGKMPGP